MSDSENTTTNVPTHLQERKTDNEEVFKSLTSALLNEFTSCACGTTGSDEVAVG
jgi:hypothetical protein